MGPRLTPEERIAMLAGDLLGEPFAWGVTDCWSLVRLFVRYWSGITLDYPQYADEQQAARALAERHPSEALVAAGAVPVEPRDATAGDILEGRAGVWPAYHVVVGRHAISSRFAGVVVAPKLESVRELCDRAWRLPCRR